MYTRICGQQQLGKCLCVAGSQPTQKKFHCKNYIRVKYFHPFYICTKIFLQRNKSELRQHHLWIASFPGSPRAQMKNRNPAFPYCKRQKTGWGLGTRLTCGYHLCLVNTYHYGTKLFILENITSLLPSAVLQVFKCMFVAILLSQTTWHFPVQLCTVVVPQIGKLSH